MREKEFMLDLHKPTAKFSLCDISCDISIPVSTDGTWPHTGHVKSLPLDVPAQIMQSK